MRELYVHVAGLKSPDFEIAEDGRPQTVASFEAVEIATARACNQQRPDLIVMAVTSQIGSSPALHLTVGRCGSHGPDTLAVLLFDEASRRAVRRWGSAHR